MITITCDMCGAEIDDNAVCQLSVDDIGVCSLGESGMFGKCAWDYCPECLAKVVETINEINNAEH